MMSEVIERTATASEDAEERVEVNASSLIQAWVGRPGSLGALVEGIGGVRVPITRDYGVLELMRDLDLPAVVVARYQLGTLNHTLLTLDTLKQNGIPVRGVIFNQSGPEAPDAIEQAQPRLIEELSGIKALGGFPYIDNLNTQSFSPEKLKELEASLDFAGLIQK